MRRSQPYAPDSPAADPFPLFTTPHVHVFATGFVVPFLIMALLQLFAVNSLDLYSSGVTLQALGVKVKRWQAVGIDTVIACGLTIYAVFDSSFSTLLKDFVDLVIVWIAPWFAIYLVDWAAPWHYRYIPAELPQRVDSGRPLLNSTAASRWAAVVAQILGMIAALQALSATFHIPSAVLNEITVHTHGADFLVVTGIAVASGLVYARAWPDPGILPNPRRHDKDA